MHLCTVRTYLVLDGDEERERGDNGHLHLHRGGRLGDLVKRDKKKKKNTNGRIQTSTRHDAAGPYLTPSRPLEIHRTRGAATVTSVLFVALNTQPCAASQYIRSNHFTRPLCIARYAEYWTCSLVDSPCVFHLQHEQSVGGGSLCVISRHSKMNHRCCA